MTVSNGRILPENKKKRPLTFFWFVRNIALSTRYRREYTEGSTLGSRGTQVLQQQDLRL